MLLQEGVKIPVLWMLEGGFPAYLEPGGCVQFVGNRSV